MAPTFGRRRPDPTPPPLPLGPDGSGPVATSTLKLRELLFAVLIACLAGATIVTFNMSAHRLFFRGLESRWDKIVSRPDFGQVPQADFFFESEQENTQLGRIDVACRSRSKTTPIDGRFADAFEESPMASEASLLRSAAYIDCLMQIEPERFCQDAHRADLTKKVGDHIALMTRVREEWAFQVPPGWVPTGNENPILQLWSIKLKGPDTSSRPDFPSTVLDPRLVAGLRDLASHGYVRRSDFGSGWFGFDSPREVRQALRGVQVTSNFCS